MNTTEKNITDDAVDWASLKTDADTVRELKKFISNLRIHFPLGPQNTTDYVAEKMNEHIRSSGFKGTDLKLEVNDNAVVSVSYTVQGSFKSHITDKVVTF